ncbi:reverse transcriptase domain-containing protein [Tanacetum coccineum]|uniref:Reverse transcriptase domain-containing protein n=1 Tax=Tanacetum coccineum TaxID=301880 RepID=A0ABQ5DAK2_9ASTR
MVISIVKGYDESERLRRSDSSICMANARHGQRVVNDIVSSRVTVPLDLYHNVLSDTAIFQLLSLLETNGRNGKPRFTKERKNIVYNSDKHRTAADLLTKDVVAIMIQTTSRSFEVISRLGNLTITQRALRSHRSLIVPIFAQSVAPSVGSQQLVPKDYNEEREMEPRPKPTRAATPPLRIASPRIRKHGERTVGFEGAQSRGESRVERNTKGGRPSEEAPRVDGGQSVNLPPLLAAHLGRGENQKPLQSSLTSAYRGQTPPNNIGGNLPSNASPRKLHWETTLWGIPAHLPQGGHAPQTFTNSNMPSQNGFTYPANMPANSYPFYTQPMYTFPNVHVYTHANLTSDALNLVGSITPFMRWIEDYPLPDGLKMPSHIGSYDGKGDLYNFLHLFEGAIRMQKWLMLIACHMFTYTLKDSARIWWNSQKAGSILDYEDLKATFRSHFSQQKKFTKTHLAVHNIKQREGERTRAFITRYTDDTLLKREGWPLTAFRTTEGTTSKDQRNFLGVIASGKRIEDDSPLTRDKTTNYYPAWWSQLVQGQDKNCHFHEDYGHETNQCRELKHRIEEAVKSGQLAHLVKWVKEKKKRPLKSKEKEDSPTNKHLGIEKNVPSCIDTEERMVINDKYPKQKITIGRQLPTRIKIRLRDLLKRYIDVFAWTSAHITGVPRVIMIRGETFNTEHRINVFNHAKPVKQKKRSLALETNEATHSQVEELIEAGILREVKYQTWVSNPMVVKKDNEKWKLRIDFTNINKACIREPHPLLAAEQRAEGLHKYFLK